MTKKADDRIEQLIAQKASLKDELKIITDSIYDIPSANCVSRIIHFKDLNPHRSANCGEDVK